MKKNDSASLFWLPISIGGGGINAYRISFEISTPKRLTLKTATPIWSHVPNVFSHLVYCAKWVYDTSSNDTS